MVYAVEEGDIGSRSSVKTLLVPRLRMCRDAPPRKSWTKPHGPNVTASLGRIAVGTLPEQVPGGHESLLLQDPNRIQLRPHPVVPEMSVVFVDHLR